MLPFVFLNLYQIGFVYAAALFTCKHAKLPQVAYHIRPGGLMPYTSVCDYHSYVPSGNLTFCSYEVKS